jgi:hypothetical protein
MKKYNHMMNDENGHSQFLANMLKNDAYREAFTTVIGSQLTFSKEVNIDFELQADGRIDLILQEDKQAILIENKINADDQNAQIERYYRWAEKNFNINGFELYYLSPLGSNPTLQSLGNVDISKIKIISYDTHIREWLLKSIQVDHPDKETLSDYLFQWDEYLKNTYYSNWDITATRLYDFFKFISEQDFSHLIYDDEPINKSHIKGNKSSSISRGFFYINYLFDTKSVKIIYDSNEEHLYLRVDRKDFDELTITNAGWQMGNNYYDYLLCSVQDILDSDPSEIVVETIDNIFQTTQSKSNTY